MTLTDRYVVLGLASPRAGWFRTLAQWSNSSSLPVELVKCLSAEELRSRLSTGRAFSAVMADALARSLDRDLIDYARQAGTPVIVVESSRRSADWLALGAASTLPEDFDRIALLDSLRRNAVTISLANELPGAVTRSSLPEVSSASPVVAVCGPGGTGASTVAISISQGLAQRSEGVLLADLARRSEQAMLHDAREMAPGIQELVDAHRTATPARAEVVAMSFDVVERGYHLLLGLRRPTAWSTLRPRSFATTIDTLVSVYRIVVCDTDADIEGESDGGSIEVEERNMMSRTAISRSSAVFVVGQTGMKGLHSLAHLINELTSYGVPASRVIPVVNRVPRHLRQRAELARTLSALIRDATTMLSPVFLPERRIDDALRNGTALPSAVVDPLVGALDATLDRNAPGVHLQSSAPDVAVLSDQITDPKRPSAMPLHERVLPGSLHLAASGEVMREAQQHRKKYAE